MVIVVHSVDIIFIDSLQYYNLSQQLWVSAGVERKTLTYCTVLHRLFITRDF